MQLRALSVTQITYNEFLASAMDMNTVSEETIRSVAMNIKLCTFWPQVDMAKHAIIKLAKCAARQQNACDRQLPCKSVH